MINRSELFSLVVVDPAHPYGHPLVKYAVRVRDSETGRWWYIRSITRRPGSDRYIFTSDSTYAKLMTEKTARRHQMEMTPDIMGR